MERTPHKLNQVDPIQACRYGHCFLTCHDIRLAKMLFDPQEMEQLPHNTARQSVLDQVRGDTTL